jgi:ATP-binding cassette subfamily B protein
MSTTSIVLPESVKSLLSDRSPDIRFFQESDLITEHTFGKSFLIVVDNKLLILSNNTIVYEYSMDEIVEFRVDELTGGGRLTANTKQGIRHLLYYSNLYVPHFSEAVRILSHLLETNKLPPHELFDNGYCPKCNSPLPDRESSCPRCIPKMKILTRIILLTKPYKISVLLLTLVAAIGVSLQVSLPYFTKMIVDEVIKNNHPDKLPFYIWGMLIVGTLYLIARLINIRLTALISAHIVSDLRTTLHSVVQFLQLRFFNRRQPGEIVGRIMHDTSELLQFLIEGMPFLLINTLSFFAVAILLFRINWILALLVFIPVPLLIIGSAWFWRNLHPLFLRQGSLIGHMHSFLTESFQGLRVVKALSKENYRINQFHTINRELSDTQIKTQTIFGCFNEIMFFIMSSGVTLVWYYSANMITSISPQMTLGDLFAFIGYVWLFYGPLQWFSVILNWMTHAFSGAERIFEIIDSNQEQRDPIDAIDIPSVKGFIEFNNVHFSYERGKETIKGISFKIKAGEIIGLVGRSGAGKSTIINLLTRFFEPDSGDILVDNHSIKQVKLLQLRQNIGLVQQEPFLFNSTIAENIAWGCEDQISFRKIVEAARAANAHDFIIRKPDGYDTLVGDGGVSLSGGERQRIAIARAILQNPPILILDEATSSVDNKTEHQIQEAIHTFMKGRTTIAIAHRLSTLRRADRLIVVDKGTIVEQGTHSELISQKGLYAEMADSYTKMNNLQTISWN